MITNVADYFTSGCGRCPRFDTPDCSAMRWKQGLDILRAIVLDCGLTETLKWGHPVYTLGSSNIVMIGAFREFFLLSFFKGVLLQDEQQILSAHGENSQSTKIVRFTDVQQVLPLETVLKAYIYEAIEVEKSGAKVVLKKVEDYPVPEEFQQALENDPALKTAFQALTPGRRRGYLLHFSQPKQSQTRYARIEKCMPAIFAGKGMNE